MKSALAGTWLTRALRTELLTCMEWGCVAGVAAGWVPERGGAGMRARTDARRCVCACNTQVRGAWGGACGPRCEAHPAAQRRCSRLLERRLGEVLSDGLLLHHLPQHLVQALGDQRLAIKLARHGGRVDAGSGAARTRRSTPPPRVCPAAEAPGLLLRDGLCFTSLKRFNACLRLA